MMSEHVCHNICILVSPTTPYTLYKVSRDAHSQYINGGNSPQDHNQNYFHCDLKREDSRRSWWKLGLEGDEVRAVRVVRAHMKGQGCGGSLGHEQGQVQHPLLLQRTGKEGQGFARESWGREKVAGWDEKVRQYPTPGVVFEGPKKVHEAAWQLLRKPLGILALEREDVEEGGLPMIGAQGVQLLREAPLQCLNQTFEEPEAGLTAGVRGNSNFELVTV